MLLEIVYWCILHLQSRIAPCQPSLVSSKSCGSLRAGIDHLIGLSLRVRLLRALPPRYRVDIRIKSGTHQSEHAVNKQLNDKERVQAALENKHLLSVVEGCLATAGKRGE